jgi:hypothetical protein
MNPKVLLTLALCGCASAPPAGPEAALALGAPESRALAIVRIPAPWWAPRFVITRKFIQSIPEYAAAAGLEQKAYTVADDGRFGGVYLWESRPAAEAWFNRAWHERVIKTRGVDGDVRILDAIWTVPGNTQATGEELSLHGLKTDAVATWVSSTAVVPATEREPRLRALAASHGAAAGLVRVSFVAASDGEIGAVALWSSRAAAEAFWTSDRAASLGRAVGSAVEVTWFSAPVLLDSAAAKRDAKTSAAATAGAP